MLELTGVTAGYDDDEVLHDIDLTVSDGEIVTVLGPSGSGKSTLLRVIAGLEAPRRGTMTWDGRDLIRVPVHERHLGLMFQDHALFAHRNVLANVGFGLRMQHVGPAETDRRARAALARVGLDGFEARRVRELSGGEQQRVALARAIAPEPRLLMLDEPLGSLDRHLRDRLVVELREVFRSLRMTTLFVTHDLDEAFSLADRVIVLRDGRVAQVGDPESVWTRPATEWLARFLGFANVTDATVRGGEAVGAWGRFPAGILTDGTARLAVRAEGLRVDADGPVEGVVSATTYHRDHVLAHVASALGPLVVAVAPDARPRQGASVRLRADPAAVVVLPPPP